MNYDIPSTLGPSGGLADELSGPRAPLPNFACDLFPLPRPPLMSMVPGLSRRSSQRL